MWKAPDAGKDWGKEEKGWQMRWLDGIIDSMDTNVSKLWEQWRTEKPGMPQSMGSQKLDMTEWLDNNETRNEMFIPIY